MDTVVVIAIILLFLGTGVIWLGRKEGSFAWHWKNKLLGEMGAEAKGPEQASNFQTQKNSENVSQQAAKDVPSEQTQDGVKQGKQVIK